VVLHLRVFGSAHAMAQVAESLSGLGGARHITRAETGHSQGIVIVTADLHADSADAAVRSLHRLGVPADDFSLLRIDAIQPLVRRPRAAGLVWADLLGQAGEHARPVARYLAFMAAAGIIAAYGVIYDNQILIVGAMAVSPDLLPITSICIGLVLRRGGLVAGALWTLAAGLACTCVVAATLTKILDLTNGLPSGFAVGESALTGLTTLNNSTFVVALAAGVVGMLALETRASSAVGVAISVTTIPASAYLGVAAGVGEADKAAGAAAVLGVNVAMLTLGGTAALLFQRLSARRAAARMSRP
jgi:uncharacterized hydrophobic protein (TIGR00271 family)